VSNLQETLLRPERARSGGRVTWFTVLGLVLVPLTVGGLLTWALWQPTERLSRMDAAVVNLDTPVKVNGQTVPLGRQLAGGLVTSTGATSSSASSTASASTASASAVPSASPTASTASTASSSVANVSGSDASTNFTWVITDASDAAAGLADGRYATVVTIPSDFSAAATSTATDPTHPTRATIGIAMSDRARIVDTAVAQAVTSTAVRVLGQQLTTTYLQNVFVGFDTLHGSLAQAADGAGSLASGAQSLTGGAQQLATGAGQVGTGATSLATGLGTLSSGATTLASSLDQLATQTSAAARSAAAGVPGAQQLASGLSALSAGVNGTGGLASGTASLSTGAAQLKTGLGTFLDGISQLAAGCRAGQTALCDQLTATIAAQQSTTAPAAGQQPSLVYSTGALAQGAAGLDAAVNTGATSIASSTTQLAAGGQQLASGISQSASGLTTLAGYLRQSATGAHQLASGAAQSASGASALATGASQVSSGAGSLGTGAGSLASGATSLADGLGQAVAKVPASTPDQAKTLAGVVADPVASASGSTDLFGSNSVPFLLAVALWLGGLATFLVLGAQPARALGSTRSSLSLALRAFAPAALIGAIQGVVLTASMGGVLHLSPGGWIEFGAVAALSGVVFAAVNQGLVAVFRGVGRFVSVVIAVVALATVVVSTVPAVLDSTFGLLPPSPALAAMQAVSTGNGSVLGPVMLLVLWALAGIGLTVGAIARHRVVPAGQLARWARAA